MTTLATLPGLEAVPAARAVVAADELGQTLTRCLLEPRGSISSRTGAMEIYAPLFRESSANPQPGLFDSPIPAASAELLDLLESAGDFGTDLWNF